MSCLISDLVLIFDFMSYVIVGPVCYICFSFSQSCEIFKSFIFAKFGLHSFGDILSEILLSNSLFDSVGVSLLILFSTRCCAGFLENMDFRRTWVFGEHGFSENMDFRRTWIFGEHGFSENMVIMCDHFNNLIAVRLHVFKREF